MRDKYTDLIRIGVVSSIDPVKCTARVTFEDRDDIVTGDLPIVVPFTLNDKVYYMPAIGERVRVLFDPEAPSKGCILGSYYADTRLPPISDENKTYIKFEDDTLIEYDKRLHTLTINILKAGDKSIDVITKGNISVECSENLNIKAAKNITIESNANISITSIGNMDLKSAGTMSIESAGAMILKGATIALN